MHIALEDSGRPVRAIKVESSNDTDGILDWINRIQAAPLSGSIVGPGDGSGVGKAVGVDTKGLGELKRGGKLRSIIDECMVLLLHEHHHTTYQRHFCHQYHYPFQPKQQQWL